MFYYTIPRLKHREETLLANLHEHGVPQDKIQRIEGIDAETPGITTAQFIADASRRFPEYQHQGWQQIPIGDLVYTYNIRSVLESIAHELTPYDAALLLEDDWNIQQPWQAFCDCVAKFPDGFSAPNAVRFHCWTREPHPVIAPACKEHEDFTTEMRYPGEHGICVTQHGAKAMLQILAQIPLSFLEYVIVDAPLSNCYTFRYPNSTKWISSHDWVSYREKANERILS